MPVKAGSVICSPAIGVSEECGFHVKPLFGFQFLRVFANPVAYMITIRRQGSSIDDVGLVT